MDKLTRSDAWGENLPEETRWEIYRWSKTPIEGESAGEGAGTPENSAPRLPRFPEDVTSYLSQLSHVSQPSRSAWYRFLARMRKEEMVRRVYAVQCSGEVAEDMAKVVIDDAKAAEALKGLAIDAAMSGDDKAAAIYANAATAFRDRAQRERELAIKSSAEVRKDEELKLAREKFEAAEKRLNAATKAVTDETLTDEQRVGKIKEIFGLK